MANQVPEKLINYRIYGNGEDLLGTADVTLPSLEAMSETISGAGIAGEVDSPTLGHFGSTTATLNWRTLALPLVRFAAQQAHDLDMRGAQQVFDAGSGEYIVQPVRVICRAIPKNTTLGSLTVGASSESSSEFEVVQMKVFIDGRQVLEMDKYNFKFEVNGVDFLSGVRNALGLN